MEAAFFLLFKTVDVNFVQKCQICVENEKPESVKSSFPEKIKCTKCIPIVPGLETSNSYHMLASCWIE